MTCNADILAQARSNVADCNHGAHRGDILAGGWDAGTLVKAEVERLLKAPVLAEGDDA